MIIYRRQIIGIGLELIVTVKAKFENRSWTEIGRLLIPRGWGRQSFSAGYIKDKFIILGGADTFTQELFHDVSDFSL